MVQSALPRTRQTSPPKLNAPGSYGFDFECVIFKCFVIVTFMNISNATSLVTCSGPYWWKVNTGSSNGLVPSGNKILPWPMLTRRQLVKKTKLFIGCLMTLPSNGITTEARFSILYISILVNVVFCGVELPLKPQTYVFLKIEVFRSSKWIKAVENAGLWCITMS